MGVDDRPANRQPHPHSAGLGSVECLENALDMVRVNAWPRIAHLDEDAMCRALPGADRQLTRPFLDRAHGFGRVEDQVQDDLLQLNTIPLNGGQPLRQAGLDRTPVLTITLRANPTASLAASFRSKQCFRGGAFLM